MPMNVKKILTITAIVFSVFMLSSSAALADSWHVCTVAQAGVNALTGVVFVEVDEVSDANWSGTRWFTISGSDAKTVLAVALSAQSLSEQVSIQLVNTTTRSALKGLYLKPE